MTRLEYAHVLHMTYDWPDAAGCVTQNRRSIRLSDTDETFTINFNDLIIHLNPDRQTHTDTYTQTQTRRNISQTFWHWLPIFQADLHCALHRVATSSCRGHVDELATEPFLLLHREHGTGYRRSWNCYDLKTFLFHSVYGHQDPNWLCDVPSVF